MKKQAMEFCERLGIEYSEGLLPYYERGLKHYRSEGLRIFDSDRLRRINKKYNIFRTLLDRVLEAGEIIQKNPDLVLYNYIAREVIADKVPFNKLLSLPDRGCVETDHSVTYAILSHLEDAIARLEKRNLPLEIISDTLGGIESEMIAYFEFNGRYGTRGYVGWYSLFLHGEIIRVGRLQYQFIKFSSPVRVFRKGDDVAVLMDGVDMHKKGMLFGSLGQCDEEGKYFADIKEEGNAVTGYRANRYGEVDPEPVTLVGYSEPLKRGDTVLAIHITNSEPFNFELVQASFAAADEFFPQYYPDVEVKGYFAHSWVLEKRLRDIMGRDTNITRLADMFVGIPTKGNQHGAYMYLFGVEQGTPAEALPERSSMQRAVKKYLQDGNYFYDKAGIRLI
ncbi:MAG: hypothetical protein IJW48_01335 [Clostridia bacterium]|nr:hypothetical protein [Clostridia bacterium]